MTNKSPKRSSSTPLGREHVRGESSGWITGVREHSMSRHLLDRDWQPIRRTVNDTSATRVSEHFALGMNADKNLEPGTDGRSAPLRTAPWATPQRCDCQRPSAPGTSTRVLRLRSGFRLRAQTPAMRLRFKSPSRAPSCAKTKVPFPATVGTVFPPPDPLCLQRSSPPQTPQSQRRF